MITIIINGNLAVDIPRGSASFHCFHWNLKCLFLWKGGKPEDPEKNSRSNDKNQQQTQPLFVLVTIIFLGHNMKLMIY